MEEEAWWCMCVARPEAVINLIFAREEAHVQISVGRFSGVLRRLLGDAKRNMKGRYDTAVSVRLLMALFHGCRDKVASLPSFW